MKSGILCWTLESFFFGEYCLNWPSPNLQNGTGIKSNLPYLFNEEFVDGWRFLLGHKTN